MNPKDNIQIPQSIFNEQDLLHKLQHFLPAQNPLKDFVHHNSLHSFQEFSFHDAIQKANAIIGYKGYLPLKEYRELYKLGNISDEAIEYSIASNFSEGSSKQWKEKMLHQVYDENTYARIGKLREQWKTKLYINLDKEVFPVLLRVVSNYLDQGISIWQFPVINKGFLQAIKIIEKSSKESLFVTEKARQLLFEPDLSMEKLLKLVVGKEEFFEHYLFDQQFSHPGWSGMVSVLEQTPSLIYAKRKISLKDFIILELLLELDTLYNKHNDVWSPLGYKAELASADLFAAVEHDELFDIYKLWLESYEWTYYHSVLSGLLHSSNRVSTTTKNDVSFQAFFCIDDREISFRRHIELTDSKCETFGTPGHFNVVAYYQPDKSNFLSKICPAPLEPKHILKEIHKDKILQRDTHFNNKTHSLVWGWFLTQTLGFLSGLKLFKILLSPKHSAGTSYAFDHMHKDASLQVDYNLETQKSKEYQEGFTLDEMVNIVSSILKTTGLTKDYANLIYFVGHGASSTNNPYYAGYGCGACLGRPGSANARAAATMANKPEVRKKLAQKGLNLPENTWFISGLHDTTRDEVAFYDEDLIPNSLQSAHKQNIETFQTALINNSKERARRFDNISMKLSKEKSYKQVKSRSIKLFEIRPEYNHATNTLFIVGRRELTKNLFLDRRAFLNSYDYNQDPDGKLLADILGAGAGVCAGINLEYYFSRVDTHRLGAGSKLPQNIIGLIGVANGVEGDLRTGLPYQMVEIHDPLRLMTVIEQKPDVVQSVLNSNKAVKEWYYNNWMNLLILDPSTQKFYVYQQDQMIPFDWDLQTVKSIPNLDEWIKSSRDNLAVMALK